MGLLDEERCCRMVAKDEFSKLVELEEIMWKQKSRVHWLKEGDENTAFFHKMASCRRGVNMIRRLKVGNSYMYNEMEIRAHMEDYFINLFSKPYPRRPTIDGLHIPRISNFNAAWLERPFCEEEVKTTVWDLEGDKAPRLDGFPIAFYTSCWEVVKEDLMNVFNDFYNRSFLDKGIDSSNLSLIPKKVGVELVSDFHPICLLGSTYKIISKCLASRLKSVLTSMVSQAQGAFLKGRSILDGSLCANKCIDSRIREGTPRVFCKGDMEKAYDHVSWSFLLDVLRRFGFGVKWHQ